MSNPHYVDAKAFMQSAQKILELPSNLLWFELRVDATSIRVRCEYVPAITNGKKTVESLFEDYILHDHHHRKG